jgi:small redox-active disulfide protein 2
MLNITVFGPGCARCKQTAEVVRQAVEQTGVKADVQKVSDPIAMAKAGVLLTPAVAVNGAVKSSGRIPSESEIRNWISAVKSA